MEVWINSVQINWVWPVLTSQALLDLCGNKNIHKNVAWMSTEPGTSAISIWGSPFWAIEAGVTCGGGRDLRSLCGHAPLVLTQWSKSKIQMVQEQKTY